MKPRKRGSAWRVASDSVPRELLDAMPNFVDPVEKAAPHEHLLFKPLVETFSALALPSCDWRASGAMWPLPSTATSPA